MRQRQIYHPPLLTNILPRGYTRASMTRHAKNNNAGSHFTHFERTQLRSRYGTQTNRLYQDSLRPLTVCWLCLNSCTREPMTCDRGHVACKECWLKSLLEQRQSHAKQQLQLLDQQLERERAQQEAEKQAQLARIAEFERQQDPLIKGALQIRKKMESVPTLAIERVQFVSKCLAAKDTHSVSLKSLLAINWTISDSIIICPLCSNPLVSVASLYPECGHAVCSNCAHSTDKCSHCEVATAKRRLELHGESGTVTATQYTLPFQ